MKNVEKSSKMLKNWGKTVKNVEKSFKMSKN